MADKSLEDAVLAVVKDPDYKPVKPRGIAKKLDLDEEQTRELKRVVKRLVKRGAAALRRQSSRAAGRRP